MEEKTKNPEMAKSEKEKNIATTDSLKYAGNVKVSIQKGKKIISTKAYHNTGLPNLFKFLCNCLAGTYNSGSRPCRIALFDKAASESENPTTGIDHQDYWSSDLQVTAGFILYDTTPVVKVTKTDNVETGFTTTYHFRIPFTLIKQASTEQNTSTVTKIYKAALYNLNASNSYSDRYAYYLFTDGTDWDPVEINTGISGNFSLIIEWIMSVTNQ